jgi:hypothetical protein
VSFPPAGKVAVLLPVQQSAVFFQQWLSDDSLQAAVQAVLVDDTGECRLMNDVKCQLQPPLGLTCSSSFLYKMGAVYTTASVVRLQL